MWLVDGNEVIISFDDTQPSINGIGKQTFHPRGGDNSGMRTLDDAAPWSIDPLSNGRPDVDLTGDWWKAIQKNPDTTHYQIHYHGAPDTDEYEDKDEEEIPSVGFAMVVPDILFDKYLSIWKDIIIGGSQVSYRLLFGFIGFPVKEAVNHEHPTVEKWQAESIMDARPICGSEFSLSFRNIPKNLEVE